MPERPPRFLVYTLAPSHCKPVYPRSITTSSRCFRAEFSLTSCRCEIFTWCVHVRAALLLQFSFYSVTCRALRIYLCCRAQHRTRRRAYRICPFEEGCRSTLQYSPRVYMILAYFARLSAVIASGVPRMSLHYAVALPEQHLPAGRTLWRMSHSHRCGRLCQSHRRWHAGASSSFLVYTLAPSHCNPVYPRRVTTSSRRFRAAYLLTSRRCIRLAWCVHMRAALLLQISFLSGHLSSLTHLIVLLRLAQHSSLPYLPFR